MLTIADYREAGGVRGAIASTADELIEHLDGDGQRLLRSLFVELAELSETGEPTRRRILRSTIADLLGTTPDVAERVLAPVIDARLVVSDGEHVQIAHEALLREWPRVRAWLEEDRERIRFRRAISDQAAEWDAGGRRPSDRLAGGRLELASDDLALGTEGWPSLAREYVEESVAARETARQAERLQLVAQRRANRRLRLLLASVAGLLVVALVAGAIALSARRSAVDEADRARAEQARADEQAAAADTAAAEARAAARTADARRLVSQSAGFTTDPSMELLTAVEAVRREPLPSAEARLLEAVSRSPAVVRHVADPNTFAPQSSAAAFALRDDAHAAFVGPDGLRAWQAGGPGPPTISGPLAEPTGPGAVVRSASGYLVATGTDVVAFGIDGSPGQPTAVGEPVLLMIGSPAGNAAAALLTSGDIVLLDTTEESPRVVRTVPPASPEPLTGVAVADDGRLAAMYGTTAYSWDRTGAALAPIPTNGVGRGLAFLGEELVRATTFGVFALADLPSFDSGLGAVGEAVVATRSVDESGAEVVTTSDPADATELDPAFIGFPVLAVSGSPGGPSRVATISDSTIFWSNRDPSGSVSVGQLDPGLGFLYSVALSTDGSTALVAASTGLSVVALDGRDALDRVRVPLGDAGLTAVVSPRLSPDGTRLALLTGPNETPTSEVIDLATGAVVSPVIDGFSGFADDETIVAGTVGSDGLVLRSLDAATGESVGEETLVADFTPWSLVAEDPAGGRVVLAGSFGASSGAPDQLVVLERDRVPGWRVLDGIGATNPLALRPGHAEAWTLRDGRLARVDLATAAIEEVPEAGDGLTQLDFSGDGLTLFVSAGPRLAALDLSVDPAVDRPVARLVAVLPTAATALTADATGTRLAVQQAGQVVLVDVASGETLSLGNASAAMQLAFLPDGDLLLIGTSELRVLGLDVDRLVAVACRMAGRVQTPAEWERYGPQDVPYSPACAA